MTQEHPITPPPELVQQWVTELVPKGMMAIATQAARWGADQELEACINYFLEYDSSWGENSELITGLRAARRPKPPSLKEQALEVLNEIESGKHGWLRIFDNLTTIRRALESLPD